MSFRKFGGLNYSARNNIIRNHYSSSDNQNITNVLGQTNSKIVSESNIDLSGNYLLNSAGIYFMDGTVITTATGMGAQGAQGAQGDQGPQGAQGAQGDQGPQGAQGDQGPQGAQGAQGDQGPQGAQGFQGPQGAQGDQGPQGAQGAQGDQGPQGAQGFQGPQGAQGDLGPQGPQGDTGPQGYTGAQGAIGAIGGIGTFSSTSYYSDGATLTTSNYIQLGAANSSNPGLMSIAGQTFSGAKTFADSVTTYSSLAVYSGSSQTVSIASTGDIKSIGDINLYSGSSISGTATINIYSANGDITTTSGTISASSFNSTSDYRIKDNIENVKIDYYNIDNLRPVTYYNKLTNKTDIGFIAHEVQEQFPFLVNGEKDGKIYQSINYIGIIPVLVKEIQELKKRITELEER